MSNKNVYEVLEDFKNAKTKQERIDVLQKNNTFALRSVLAGTFDPTIKFDVEVPEYKCEPELPPGMSYSNMTTELNRMYLFVEGDLRRPAGLTEKRAKELLIQIFESLEEKEAAVLANMLRKDQKIKTLTPAIINEAFPGLLPEPKKS